MLKHFLVATYAIIVRAHIFINSINYIVKCLNCGQIIRNLDFFMDLQLDLPVKKKTNNPVIKKQIEKNHQKSKEEVVKILENEELMQKNSENNNFMLINSEEINEKVFPDFDKNINDLYEPVFDANEKNEHNKQKVLFFFLK